MHHARPAVHATVVIALGLVLTVAGLARGLPHEIGGLGSRATIAADLWAHGTAISLPLVVLVAIGLLAAWAGRRGSGGGRAARWLTVVGVAGLVAGWMEPAHQRILLLGEGDPGLTVLVLAADLALIALIVAAILRARDGRPAASRVARPPVEAAAAA